MEMLALCYYIRYYSTCLMLSVLPVEDGGVSVDVQGEGEQPGQPGDGEGGQSGQDVLGRSDALEEVADPRQDLAGH